MQKVKKHTVLYEGKEYAINRPSELNKQKTGCIYTCGLHTFCLSKEEYYKILQQLKRARKNQTIDVRRGDGSTWLRLKMPSHNDKLRDSICLKCLSNSSKDWRSAVCIADQVKKRKKKQPCDFLVCSKHLKGHNTCEKQHSKEHHEAYKDIKTFYEHLCNPNLRLIHYRVLKTKNQMVLFQNVYNHTDELLQLMHKALSYLDDHASNWTLSGTLKPKLDTALKSSVHSLLETVVDFTTPTKESPPLSLLHSFFPKNAWSAPPPGFVMKPSTAAPPRCDHPVDDYEDMRFQLDNLQGHVQFLNDVVAEKEAIIASLTAEGKKKDDKIAHLIAALR